MTFPEVPIYIKLIRVLMSVTKAEVSYVEANKIGFSSLETKFLITCLIVSVDKTVEIPNLLPNNEARVLFPVPDVPASKTRIFLFDSNNRLNERKHLHTKSEAI